MQHRPIPEHRTSMNTIHPPASQPSTSHLESLRIARAFANDPFACDPDQRPLYLARRLKTLGGTPDDYEDAVRVYCEESGESWLDTWTDFYDLFPKIKFVDIGGDTLAWADEQATQSPIPLPDNKAAPHDAYIHVY